MRILNRERLINITVFISGAFCYGLCELLFRGRTHITMGLLGGAAMLFIHRLNDKRRGGMYILPAAVLGALFITAAEYISGLVLNVSLGLAVWDYSELSFNYRGQICLEYSLKWVLISIMGMLVDELIRVSVFKSDVFIINKIPLHIPKLFKQQRSES